MPSMTAVPFGFFPPNKVFFVGCSPIAAGALSRIKAGPALILLRLVVLPMPSLLLAVCGLLLDLVPDLLMKLEMLSIVSKRFALGRSNAGDERAKILRSDFDRAGDCSGGDTIELRLPAAPRAPRGGAGTMLPSDSAGAACVCQEACEEGGCRERLLRLASC